jgi:hypothetical protein
MTERRRRILRTLALIASLAVAVFAATSMIGNLRAVDVVSLFFGGFGAGVATIGFVHEWRERRGGRPGGDR